jgi:hypothetical protein
MDFKNPKKLLLDSVPQAVAVIKTLISIAT